VGGEGIFLGLAEHWFEEQGWMMRVGHLWLFLVQERCWLQKIGQ